MLLYPVYAVLFAEHGLSPAEISSLFVIWSVTAFVLEVPSGLWADLFSRRRLLAIAPALAAAGFALWTYLPCYASFAGGFVLWGAGGALRSGALEALVYEELERAGRPGAYARLIGRSRAIGTTGAVAATALASPVLAAGGHPAVGAASVAASLLAVPVGCSFPESRRGEQGDDPQESYAGVLRAGLAEVRRSAPVRRALLLVSVVSGATALDEYVPLLVESTGVGAPSVPLFVLLVTGGTALGGWCAGRGVRWTGPALAVAAGCLALGALSGSPAGLVLVAVAFAILEWAIAAAEARLQEGVTDRWRATVTSMAGFGEEVTAVLVFGGYALGSAWAGPGPLFAVAAVPFLLAAAVAGAAGGRRRG